MTLLTMYPFVVGGGGTRLTSEFKSTDTTVNVVDATRLPDAPNYISIIDENYVITLLYTSKTGTTVSGLTVTEYSPGGDVHTFPSNSTAGRTINKVDMDAFSGNITTCSDYTNASNKPSVASVTLVGNKTLGDLGAATVTALTEHTDDSTIHVTASDKTAWNGKVDDVTLNGTSVVATGTAGLVTVDNVTSAGNLNPLTANQGKLLNDRINNLETIGRFLSLWNCSTGLPATNPSTSPYTYKTGDYYIISTVGTTTNYKPDGTTYTAGVASTAVTTDDVATGDIWRFDGTTWSFEQNHASSSGVSDVTVAGTSVVSSGVAVIPSASASATGVLSSGDWSTFNAKQKAITVSTSEPTAAEGSDGDIWLVYTP